MQENSVPELQWEFDGNSYPGLIVLQDFDRSLTTLHSFFTCSHPDVLHHLFGLFARGKSDTTRQLLRMMTPRVRLHSKGVALFQTKSTPHSMSAEGWLASRGFNFSSSMRRFCTTAESPFLDGFFRCLRLLGEHDAPLENDDPIEWSRVPTDGACINDILLSFVTDEKSRCQQYLGKDRRNIPHPPLFETDTVQLEFAASVWSPSELRIWSRPISHLK